MGEAFITRRGGGIPYAVIGVTYPEGGVCTCTNGTLTLTANDTSGKAVFVIPEAGTWTVKAVSGSRTASKAVSITAEGQVETVTLTYELYIFKAGQGALVDLDTKYMSNATVAITSDAITLNWTGADYFQTAILTAEPIDLTSYSKFAATANVTRQFGWSGFNEILAVVDKTSTAEAIVNQPNDDSQVIAKTEFEVKNDTFYLDLSALKGEYKVGIKGIMQGSVTEMWLIP